jgi:putative transposase
MMVGRCLRPLYLIFIRVCAWLVPLGRSPASNDAEVLVLCHEFAVAAPHPSTARLDWADRAVMTALV